MILKNQKYYRLRSITNLKGIYRYNLLIKGYLRFFGNSLI